MGDDANKQCDNYIKIYNYGIKLYVTMVNIVREC